MSVEGYRVTLAVFTSDGRRVGEVALDRALTVDWAPAEEWVRLQALRRHGIPAGASEGDGVTSIEPVWHAGLGQPYVEAFRVSVIAGDAVTADDIDAGYLASQRARAVAHFVSTGALAKEDRVACIPAAYRCDRERRQDVEELTVAADVSSLPTLHASRLDAFTGSQAALGPGEACDIPVFVPERVLDEAAALAGRAGDCETGGVLIGRLHRDAAVREVFAEVTAQVPARHTTASASRLTFTREAWTDVRAAIALRRSDEVMLGWWHSHPVRVWCRDCPADRQAVCPLAAGFFSEHDRGLHRTLFPRAYSVGLLVNDLATGPTFSVFGWRRGVIAARGFSLLGATGRDIVCGRGTTVSPECRESREGTDHGHATI